MKRRAIFLDRDGTINVEKKYLHRIEDFEFLPGVIEALKLFQDAGYLLIIITNQSGIGRGFYTEEDFQILNVWMIDKLKKMGIDIDKVYYCPHLPNAIIEKYRIDCKCRKPAIGLYEKAINDFDIDMEKSFAIGDKIRDCAICEKMNCNGYLIANNESENIIQAVQDGNYKNIAYEKDLLECAKLIVRMYNT